MLKTNLKRFSENYLKFLENYRELKVNFRRLSENLRKFSECAAQSNTPLVYKAVGGVQDYSILENVIDAFAK